MQHDLTLKESQKEWHGTYRSYAIGLVNSLILTILAFYLVETKSFEGTSLIYVLGSLALLQAVCQLLFFLHLGQESTPRWETVIFFFMLLILFIIVAGSLWIMSDLNERMMSMEMMKHD